MLSHLRSSTPRPLALLLLAFTLAAVAPVAEEVHVTGRVMQAGTELPLANAQISVGELGVGTLTGADGRYALNIPRAALQSNGVYLSAELIGFSSQQSLLRLPADGDSLTVDFRLNPEPLALDEILVTGETEAVALRRDPSAEYARPAPSPAVLMKSRVRPDASRRAPVGDREQYAHIAENAFRSATDHPLSTFSIDVDRASYSNVRRFLLREGRLPPIDAVQVEEMINYFTYSYERPGSEHPVAVTTEIGDAPWAPEHRLLRVGLASRPIAAADMPPANLVFLLDVSGSMGSPDKLPLVQSSMRLLVDQMRAVDRVAIVVYAGAAGLVLEPTSGTQKEVILEAIDRLNAGGSTAGGEGLRLAYQVAQRNFRPEGNNRVILATDGDFNVGESSDAGMIRLVEEKRAEGTFLTVLGFGTGNLQSEKMQSMAQHGNGNYAYIDGLQEARKVLVGEMGGTLLTVAKDVKVQIEFNPTQVGAYRLLGYENRLLAAEDFNDDARDAGELGAGHTVTALYEIIPAGVESDALPPGIDPLRYSGTRGVPEQNGGDELAFVKVRYKLPSGTESRLMEHPVRNSSRRVSGDFNFAAAVAGFGMLLRESSYRGSITSHQVLALAEDGLGADTEGYRQGFLELVQAYQRLTRADHQNH